MALNPLLEQVCRLKVFYVLILLAICGSNVPVPAASAIARRKAGAFPRICRGTPEPALCARILSGTPASTPLNRQIAIITTYALRVSKAAYGAIGKDAESFRKLRNKPKAAEEVALDGRLAEGAILDCLDLMGNSMDQLRTTIGKVSSLGARTQLRAARTNLMDARVSLSASLTFQNTCQDELSQHPGAAAAKFVLREGQLITGSLEVALSLADTLQGKLRP